MNNRLNHLLLLKAGLDCHTRSVIIGAASGSYDVKDAAISLRQAFRNSTPAQSMSTHSSTQFVITCSEFQRLVKQV